MSSNKARHRKPIHHSNSFPGPKKRRAVHTDYYSEDEEELRQKKRAWMSPVLFVGVAIPVILGVLYCLYLGYLETRVITPYSAPKVVTASGLQVPDMYWGNYRPGVYFGTRVRHATSPVTGLMWFVSGHFQNNMLALRHWCEQGDDLHSYSWQKHDGRNFGSQLIRDKYVTLTTDFVKRTGGKHGGDWTARISAQPKSPSHAGRLASLLYYVALDPEDLSGSLQTLLGTSQGSGTLMGTAEALGGFRLHMMNTSGTIHHTNYLSTRHLGLDNLKKTVFRGLRRFKAVPGEKEHVGLVGDMFSPDDIHKVSNFVVFQVTGELPFEIQVVFESDSFPQRPNMLVGETFQAEFDRFNDKFDFDFSQKFPLKNKGYNDEEIKFAKAALSNMVGGIGYFYGASKVQGGPDQEPVPYWKAGLYTAVPSRSFFPRGFLWDEGFHNLLISKWDRGISFDILSHWFDLMNWDGWIPREQILGVEARDRVPDEFVVQKSKNANPPTLLLTLHSMMTKLKEETSDYEMHSLKLMWPRLRGWYNWFNTTQTGPMSGSYRWRGRDPLARRELNPKTLTSGLDDYPRASHPTDDERHLDLRCWMTLASGLMADIAKMIGKDHTSFEESYNYLSDNKILDKLHWSNAAEGYMDYGLHTFDVQLKKLNPNTDKVRVTNSDPKLRYVDMHGYLSFFPLFLQILDPHSPKLGKVLSNLRNSDLLWSKYGLRSLAKNSPLYMQRNTEHDPPYWRGPIWINMNYLCVRALHHYANTPGPYVEMATKLYSELRENLINLVIREYNRTGYVWEQYNEDTGKGQGCRPFTGWSTLVVLMMAESY